MGLFDFVFHIGAKFTRDEIKILDMNFNSISAYTKKNYRFFLKDVGDNILASESGGYHRIDYRHQDIDTDEFNRDQFMMNAALDISADFPESSLSVGISQCRTPLMVTR